ncbi:MarR family winged helix-turn-helix transcriptional regulator [Streptomyces sp. NPDC048172]|uniref:MarR family winged helix-turn-helix transcriptional regulator n=1 Tax=Streptomyces sp. NPDC048172 TaxID=3365505 RepID=UPI0037156E7C
MSRQPSPSPEGPHDDPYAVAVRLRAAAGDLVRAARVGDTLPPVQAAVLDLLDRRGPMTTADLAAARKVRHQTMAVTVKELVATGQLAAVRDEGDGRKKVLHLTPAGSGALDADRQDRVRRLTEALAHSLDNGELRELAHALPLLDKVAAAMARDAYPGSPGSPSLAGRRNPLAGTRVHA